MTDTKEQALQVYMEAIRQARDAYCEVEEDYEKAIDQARRDFRELFRRNKDVDVS